MAKPYRQLRDQVGSDPTRAARVAAHRQAMEDALALAEIRAQRELTQTDIAHVLSTSQANVSRIERQRDRRRQQRRRRPSPAGMTGAKARAELLARGGEGRDSPADGWPGELVSVEAVAVEPSPDIE